MLSKWGHLFQLVRKPFLFLYTNLANITHRIAVRIKLRFSTSLSTLGRA